jgi:hypothetical protein
VPLSAPKRCRRRQRRLRRRQTFGAFATWARHDRVSSASAPSEGFRSRLRPTRLTALHRRRQANTPTERRGYNTRDGPAVSARGYRETAGRGKRYGEHGAERTPRRGVPTNDGATERTARRRGECRRLPREYGVRRVVRLRYRKLIFLLDTALRRWYRGDSCLKKDGRRTEARGIADRRLEISERRRRNVGWQGVLHSLAPARLGLWLSATRICVAPLPAAWLYREEYFYQTNPFGKCGSIAA